MGHKACRYKDARGNGIPLLLVAEIAAAIRSRGASLLVGLFGAMLPSRVQLGRAVSGFSDPGYMLHSYS